MYTENFLKPHLKISKNSFQGVGALSEAKRYVLWGKKIKKIFNMCMNIYCVQ